MAKPASKTGGMPVILGPLNPDRGSSRLQIFSRPVNLNRILAPKKGCRIILAEALLLRLGPTCLFRICSQCAPQRFSYGRVARAEAAWSESKWARRPEETPDRYQNMPI